MTDLYYLPWQGSVDFHSFSFSTYLFHVSKTTMGLKTSFGHGFEPLLQCMASNVERTKLPVLETEECDNYKVFSRVHKASQTDTGCGSKLHAWGAQKIPASSQDQVTSFNFLHQAISQVWFHMKSLLEDCYQIKQLWHTVKLHLILALL